MAAVRMARTTATEEAFEHLLNFGFTYKGSVITQITDAVSEVALHLVRQGKTDTVDRLAHNMIGSPSNRQRLVSAEALAVLASSEHQTILLPYTESFIPLIYNESRDEIERGLLLDTLGYLAQWVIPESMLNDILSWAQKPDQWFGRASLRILANHGKLEQHAELMSRVLNLEPDGDLWRMTSTEIRFEWAPYIIGLLYHRNPTAYVPVIITLLSNPDWGIPVQVIRWLSASHGHNGQPDLHPAIIDALISRVQERNSTSYGETGVLVVLARLAPRAVAEHRWADVTTSWMPDARLDLANALMEVNIGPESLGQCLSTLEKLALDGTYAVRRAAYRALSRQSTGHLYGLCRAWLESPLLNLNTRAAEACGWIENVRTDDGHDGFDELYQRCKNHLEPKVRDAVTRSWKERRHRLWAREYLGKVKSVQGVENAEVLRNRCYGDALSQIGDDECLEDLREHLTDKPLPPNVRHWVRSIREELQKNWRQTTQKWPEPWVDMSGAIENGIGKLILSATRAIDVRYSVWRVPATSPEEQHSWGGTISALSESELRFRTAVVELEGGRRGEIILTTSTNNVATFHGTGPYPRSS